MVFLNDRLTFDKDARICADGCLVAEVFAARTGLQDYLGSEVDPQGERFKRDAVVKVYRPESEVFKTDSLATFAGAPVTVDHPAEAVTADNWKSLGVGEIHGDVIRDGERVRVPIIVRDAAAVRAATSTHKQLSMGYATKLVFPQDGKHPDGTACDAYQTDLKINHIALVRAARGGPELRVVDERSVPNTETIKMKITLDGVSVTLTDASEVQAAFDKIKADAVAADAAAKVALDAAKAENVKLAAQAVAKDADIAKLTADIEAAAITPEKLRDAAKAYADVKAKAKAFGVEAEDDDDADMIKKKVVAKKMGDAAKDYTADHIAIAFDAFVNALGNKVLPIGQIKPVNDAATDVKAAQNARMARLSNAHRAA